MPSSRKPSSPPSQTGSRSSRRKDPSRWLSIYFPDGRMLASLKREARLRRMGVSTLVRQILEERGV